MGYSVLFYLIFIEPTINLLTLAFQKPQFSPFDVLINNILSFFDVLNFRNVCKDRFYAL